jgi:eukaryotic-like serine/threonine-protein kinase
MQIAPGRRLGAYEVASPLGRGGMGEVWRARDTQLNRDVAIKLLPDVFAHDEERVARFTREAQTLASLNHPNIAQIYGIIEQDGPAHVHALVMELVEGDDLSMFIARGPLDVADALPIARQIADALEAAHEQGIVHRDLKPANIKVRLDGAAKVLDFGLAKALGLDGASAAADAANSPTITAHATQLGTIVGTAAYMAPEQARGKAVDKRADIWAFGVVLFEMLTGRRAFSGDDVGAVLAQVIEREVDWTALPAETPASLHRLISRCLQKDPRRRLRDIGEARVAVDDAERELAERPARAATEPPASVTGGPGRIRRSNPLAWSAAIVTTAAAAGLAGYFSNARPPAALEPIQVTVQLAAGQELQTTGHTHLAFTPDGRALVFPGREDGQTVLLRRLLDQAQAERIPGTEHTGTTNVFISADGRWIGFTAANKLRKISADGGKSVELADTRGAGGAAWLPDGSLVFAPIYSDGLFRISAQGGKPERLTTPDRADGVLGHWSPDPLPGGKHVLFTAFRTPVDRSRIGVLDLASLKVRWLVEGGFFARYSPSGHLLFARGQHLFAAPFDAATASVTGQEIAVLDDLFVSQTSGTAMYAVSSRGMLAYVSESSGNADSELVWLDRSGRATPTGGGRQRFLSVSLSPDGQRAAVTIQQETQDLWVQSFERGTLSRLTSGKGTEFAPHWSRDARDLFYVVDMPPFNLFRIAAGSLDSGRPVWDEQPTVDTVDPVVSPDGLTLAFARTEPETGKNLYTRKIDGNEPARALRVTAADESRPSFSPDGKWITYQSNETGRDEIYVTPYPGPGDRVQVSADGGTEPVWARNGEIFYRHREEIRVAPTRLAARFEFDAPRTLFSYAIAHCEDDNPAFDVSADGSRVLAIAVPDGNRPRRIEVVTDWTSRLARLVPAGRR